MPLQIQSEFGSVHITDHVISVLAGSAATGMLWTGWNGSRKQFKDGIAELLGRDNLSRGVEVHERTSTCTLICTSS